MRGELFTLEDRAWAAENAKKTLENRMTGTKVEIVDLEKVIKYLREKRYRMGLSPNVSILPIKEDPMKERSYSFSTFYDKAHGLLYGKFLGFSNNGNPRFKRFTVREVLDVDLTMLDQAEQWLLFCFHPKLEGSVNEDSPYFRVFDKSREAIDSSIKADEFIKASGRIRSMQLKDKLYFIRYAYPTRSVLSSYNEEILNGILFDEAFKDASLFNRKYEAKSRSMFEIFRSGVELGIIKNVPEQGYIFENLNLGVTEIDVITFLSKDNVIITSLLDKISKEDTVFEKVVSNTNSLKNNARVDKIKAVDPPAKDQDKPEDSGVTTDAAASENPKDDWE